MDSSLCPSNTLIQWRNVGLVDSLRSKIDKLLVILLFYYEVGVFWADLFCVSQFSDSLSPFMNNRWRARRSFRPAVESDGRKGSPVPDQEAAAEFILQTNIDHITEHDNEIGLVMKRLMKSQSKTLSCSQSVTEKRKNLSIFLLISLNLSVLLLR